jgi:hypothetical protein
VVPDIPDFCRELVAVVAIGIEAIVYFLGP